MDHMHGGFQMPPVGGPPPLMNQPPQIFGGYPDPGMQLHQLPPELTAQMFGDPSAFLDDANEAKRRRIARVSTDLLPLGRVQRREGSRSLTGFRSSLGLRHVQEEEDQVRRQASGLHALHQLQNRLRLHPSREEAQSSQGVRRSKYQPLPAAHKPPAELSLPCASRAKYIEGLENRLGRMESLLRLSGKICRLHRLCIAFASPSRPCRASCALADNHDLQVSSAKTTTEQRTLAH